MMQLSSLLTAFRLYVITALSENPAFTFNPQAFVDNLKYMGRGMLAIFIVIAVIVGITYILNAIFKSKK